MKKHDFPNKNPQKLAQTEQKPLQLARGLANRRCNLENGRILIGNWCFLLGKSGFLADFGEKMGVLGEI
jgi:hypothetical protein